jgi:hypothetical protein
MGQSNEPLDQRRDEATGSSSNDSVTSPSPMRANTAPKPIVWHMFGSDIEIRIVDGIPIVNGAKVEPASSFENKARGA